MSRAAPVWAGVVLLLLAAGLLPVAFPAAAHVPAPLVKPATVAPTILGTVEAPAPAAATTSADGTNPAPSFDAGRLFWGVALVAAGVAGATLMLRLLRGLPRRPPPDR